MHGCAETEMSDLQGVRALYVSYMGLREPLVQSQVLPYVRQLVAGGVTFHLLTFEKDPAQHWTDASRREWTERLRAENIDWVSLTYHKRPSLPATLYDIQAGARFGAGLVRRHGIHLVHARAHVPAAMGALIKKWTGAKLLFDIRGFNPEEYVDAGIWSPNGFKYRLSKKAEAACLAAADGFVVLSARGRDILFSGVSDTDRAGRPVEVIPCCVDLQRFAVPAPEARSAIRRELGLEDRRVLVYVGALGGWYLTDEMAVCLAAAQRRDPCNFSLILTQSPPDVIGTPLRQQSVPERDFRIQPVPSAEMPRWLGAADIALSFVKPCYSKLASSPTKIAEYLGCGLPILSSADIGDVDEVLETDRVGVLLRKFEPADCEVALEAAEALRRDPQVATRCRESAERRFGLEDVGGVRYRRLYSRILTARSNSDCSG